MYAWTGALPRFMDVPSSDVCGLPSGFNEAALNAQLPPLLKVEKGSPPGDRSGRSDCSRDVACVLLVSPSYHGVISDIQAASSICAQYQVPLIVDEAHGSHLPFLHASAPLLEMTLRGYVSRCSSSSSSSCSSASLDSFKSALRPAVARGADIAVQSTHKTLTSLTQSAMLHLGRSGAAWGSDSNHKNAAATTAEEAEVALAEALAVVSTSSPSALLLASLDSSRKFFAAPDPRLLSKQSTVNPVATDTSADAATASAATATAAGAHAASEIAPELESIPALQSSGGSRRLRRAARLASHVRHCCKALGLALFEPPGFAIDPLRVVVLVPPLPPVPSIRDAVLEVGHEQSESGNAEASANEAPNEVETHHDGSGGFAADEELIDNFGVYCELPEECARVDGSPSSLNDGEFSNASPSPVLNGGALTFAFGAGTTASHARQLLTALAAVAERANRTTFPPPTSPSPSPPSLAAGATASSTGRELSTPANTRGLAIPKDVAPIEANDEGQKLVGSRSYCMTPRDAFLSPRVAVHVQLIFLLSFSPLICSFIVFVCLLTLCNILCLHRCHLQQLLAESAWRPFACTRLAFRSLYQGRCVRVSVLGR